MFVTLDNASSNTKSMGILNPMFAGYLGSDPAPADKDPNVRKYYLIHQHCACHIINLIVKSILKRIKSYLEDFRTAIIFLNSSNTRIASFKRYRQGEGLRPRKFGLDMDVRWNATYLGKGKAVIPSLTMEEKDLRESLGSSAAPPSIRRRTEPPPIRGPLGQFEDNREEKTDVDWLMQVTASLRAKNRKL